MCSRKVAKNRLFDNIVITPGALCECLQLKFNSYGRINQKKKEKLQAQHKWRLGFTSKNHHHDSQKKKKIHSFGPTISGHIANPIQSPELKKDSTLLPQSEKREISYQLSNIQPIIKENLILQTGGVSRIKLPWRVAIPTFTFQTRTTECVAIVKIGTLLFVRTIIQNRGRFVVSPENEGTCFNKPNFDGSEQIYRCVGRKKKSSVLRIKKRYAWHPSHND